MPVHNVKSIKALQAELERRREALTRAMDGRLPVGGERDGVVSMGIVYDADNARFVDSQAVRLAVDDFATVLREIKRVLGK